MPLLHSRDRVGTLPNTDTYSDRCWQWVPAVDEPDGSVARLVIEQRKGTVREHDEYAVTELEPLPGLMGRRFKLVNMSETPPLPGFGERTTYETTVGGLPSCTCPAGQYRAAHGAHACKHLLTLFRLLEKGILDDLDEPGGDKVASGLVYHDKPGEPTAHELSPQLEGIIHGSR